MQQQNGMSPIWAIDLFERRQFRNGSEKAQCMECGESFNSCDLAAMTAHIVNKHPQYAAKLLAKQLEFGEHLQQMTKVEETECTTSKCAASISSTDDSENTTADIARTTPTDPTPSPSAEVGIARTTADAVPFDENPPPRSTTAESADDRKVKEEKEDIDCRFFGNTSATQSATSSVTSVSLRFESTHTPPPTETPNSHHGAHTNADFVERASESPTIPNFSPLSALDTTNTSAAAGTSCPPSMSLTTPTTALSQKEATTAKCSGAISDGNAIFKDRFGKEWRLLVSTAGAQLDQVASEHFLCRKGTPKYDGRIYFSCCWSDHRSSSQQQQCLHRGLFLPDRQALFYRRTHNHPTTTTAKAKAQGVSNGSAKGGQRSRTQRRRPSRCGSSNEDTVSAFSAALPDIDNLKNDDETAKTDCKIGVIKTEMISDGRSLQPPPYCDGNGKQWHWLFNLNAIDEDPEKIRQFCQAYFLMKKYTYKQNVFFICKFHDRVATKNLACPFRVVFVANRRAMFAIHSHNHPPSEEKGNDVAANEATGYFYQRTEPQQHDTPIENNDTSLGIGGCFKGNSGAGGSGASAAAASDSITMAAQFDDYVDNAGKAWKLMANIDVGECVTLAQKQRFLAFCTEQCLYREGMRRNADGSLRTYALTCKECRTNIRCPYRAIYVADRRAVFDRKMHNHSMGSRTNRQTARLCSFDASSTAQNATPEQTNAPAEGISGGGDDYEDFYGKKWHWMANIDLGECKSDEQQRQLRTFCAEHGLHRGEMRRTLDGTLRLISLLCKFRLKNCLFRAVYVVQRRAIFGRGSHDHTMAKRKKRLVRRKKHLVVRKNAKNRKKTAAKKGAASANYATAVEATKHENTQTKSAMVVAGADQCQVGMSQLQCFSSDLKPSPQPPPVLIDHLENAWHWLANLPDTSNATILNFCSQYYVNRTWTTMDGKRNTYRCRYRQAPINCPLKVMHLPERNVLYYCSAHNHPLPLSTELMALFRRERVAVQRRSLDRKRMIAAVAQMHHDHGTAKGNGDNCEAAEKRIREEEEHSEPTAQCSRSNHQNGTNGQGTVTGEGPATDCEAAMPSEMLLPISIKGNSSGE